MSSSQIFVNEAAFDDSEDDDQGVAGNYADFVQSMKERSSQGAGAPLAVVDNTDYSNAQNNNNAIAYPVAKDGPNKNNRAGPLKDVPMANARPKIVPPHREYQGVVTQQNSKENLSNVYKGQLVKAVAMSVKDAVYLRYRQKLDSVHFESFLMKRVKAGKTAASYQPGKYLIDDMLSVINEGNSTDARSPSSQIKFKVTDMTGVEPGHSSSDETGVQAEACITVIAQRMGFREFSNLCRADEHPRTCMAVMTVINDAGESVALCPYMCQAGSNGKVLLARSMADPDAIAEIKEENVRSVHALLPLLHFTAANPSATSQKNQAVETAAWGLFDQALNDNKKRMAQVFSTVNTNYWMYNGNMRIDTQNGGYFEGRVRDSRFEGKGTLQKANGVRYDGYFVGGKCHGEGKLYDGNGSLKYDGEWDMDKQTGYGRQYFPDGSLQYEGAFDNGKLVGFGLMYSEKTGSLLFEGNFDNGRKTEGKFYHKEGYVCFEGKVDRETGRYHGHGRSFYSKGVVKYEGNFDNGKMHGEGRYYYENGELKYEGEWADGACIGHGAFYSASLGYKLAYEGEWENLKQEGEGVTFDGRGRYEYSGYWKANQRDGTGKSYEFGILEYDGDWVDGKRHGEGKVYDVAAAINAGAKPEFSGTLDEDGQEKGLAMLTDDFQKEHHLGKYGPDGFHGTGNLDNHNHIGHADAQFNPQSYHEKAEDKRSSASKGSKGKKGKKAKHGHQHGAHVDDEDSSGSGNMDDGSGSGSLPTDQQVAHTNAQHHGHHGNYGLGLHMHQHHHMHNKHHVRHSKDKTNYYERQANTGKGKKG